MRPYPSPLEDLAAYAIAFFSGILFTVSLTSYVKHLC
jgi:hypothetical protein